MTIDGVEIRADAATVAGQEVTLRNATFQLTPIASNALRFRLSEERVQQYQERINEAVERIRATPPK